MRNWLIALSLLLALVVLPTSVQWLITPKALTSSVVNLGAEEPKDLPPTVEIGGDGDVKLIGVRKTLILEARNTVVLRGPVTVDSVSKAMLELRKISRRVSKDTPIFLVLDTPGGSVFDGLDLIDFANALPQKVHTVTLFAASMGFQIVQNLDRRYITRNGILMSHRASVNGIGGQIKGEVESRYKMLRRAIDFLDYQAAKRMKMDMKAYEALIVPEYWVHGYDAVAQNVTDEEVLLQCGESLNGTDKLKFETLFGSLTATVSKCPLIKGAISIDTSNIDDSDKAHRAAELILLSLLDQRQFIKDYIATGKFQEVFHQ